MPVVPTGLDEILWPHPSVETLGYFQLPLRGCLKIRHRQEGLRHSVGARLSPQPQLRPYRLWPLGPPRAAARHEAAPCAGWLGKKRLDKGASLWYKYKYSMDSRRAGKRTCGAAITPGLVADSSQTLDLGPPEIYETKPNRARGRRNNYFRIN